MVWVTHPVVEATQRLWELIDAALGDTVSVDLGPIPGRTSSPDSVVIALPAVNELAVVTAEVEYPPGTALHQLDRFEVSCMAQAVSGDSDLGAPTRSLGRCMELMEAVGAAVMAENARLATPTTGGLVPVGQQPQVEAIRWGRIPRYSTQWVKTKAGHGALVLFPVAVEARRAATTG